MRLGKMNLAVHGLAGDIRQGNAYYEDLHQSVGRFDRVMANPPFNVDRVDKDRLKDDPRFPFGLPRVDNANYLWIQIFHSALNASGRAGFVMANSASDARGSELDIRRQLIESRSVDVMVAVGSTLLHRHPALHPLVLRQGKASGSTTPQTGTFGIAGPQTGKTNTTSARAHKHARAEAPTRICRSGSGVPGRDYPVY